MAATRRIIYATVGDGGQTSGRNVRRLQRVLQALGYDLGSTGADGDWGGKTRTALAQCRANGGKQAGAAGGTVGSGRQSIGRTDPLLPTMANNAGMLIPLPGKGRGKSAFDYVHKWLISKPRTAFYWAYPPSSVWGLRGNKEYALVCSYENGVLYPRDAVLNCSTYANLMMAIWRQGHAHSSPYDADISQAGRVHFARYRYGYPLLSRKVKLRSGKIRTRWTFRTAQQVVDAVGNSKRLYCLEKSGRGGEIKHMALLLEGRVYECNEVPVSGCNDLTIKSWFNRVTHCYVSGPSQV